MLFEAGVDIKTASKLMRHADEETTLRIYTKLTKRKEQLSLDALNNALSGKSLVLKDDDE